MFKCNTCGMRFPETKGTIFYNRHLKEEQIIMVCKLLVEKNGVRAIERIMGIHRDTVSGVIEDLARHAREVTDLLIKNVGLTPIQVDEMWPFVKNDFFTKNRVKTALRVGFDFVVVTIPIKENWTVRNIERTPGYG